jgi:uncharacterized damage-inducible protein DinB
MISDIFLERSRYYLSTEYATKIRLSVSNLSYEQIWQRPNEESNSIGNLLLHLAGNVRQWIVCGVGGAKSDRDRAAEFSARNGPPLNELLALFDAAVRDADAVIALLTEDDLMQTRTIQGRETTVIAAIYHVVEHFALHAGQIIVFAKMFAPGSVQFYEDAGGKAIPRWGGSEGMSKGVSSKQ